MKIGNISSIGRHRFELDGRGVRTLIVFTGCPLKCKYCINPYTWMETDKSKQYSVEDLLKKVSIDGIYFEATHGGISFGGGEPLLQAEFISEFIDQAPVSWNYLIETSLAVPFEKIEKVATKIGKFVVDIKSLDKNIYKQYTGLDLELAYTNLLKLKEMIGSERIRVRVPLIPGFADEKSQEETIAKLFELGFTDIDAFQYIIKK